MVIEFLTFDVDPEIRERWMEVDEQTWSRFLEQQTGFVSKQLWIEQGTPEQVHAIVVWTDEATWKSIPLEEIERVDASMGEWLRVGKMKVFDVVRTS
jgi:uncharacterized protein (TIGR03792 family)